MALFYTAMLVAPRYISGGEVALVMLLEDLLGPFWVYLRFGEVRSRKDSLVATARLLNGCPHDSERCPLRQGRAMGCSSPALTLTLIPPSSPSYPHPHPHAPTLTRSPSPLPQVPSPWTVAGGGLLLATLVAHECAGRGGGRTLPTRETSNLPTHSPPPTTVRRSGHGGQAGADGEDRPYYRVEDAIKS